MICSRGKEDCKTCTKEKYDKWNEWLKSGKIPKFNPWLTQNERIRDIIRWDCLSFMVIGIAFCVLIWGWKGLFVYYLVHLGLTAGGGNWIDLNVYPEPKIKQKDCSLVHKNCKYLARYIH